jgi:hypothetical protein
MKNKPPYAIESVDHALRLAQLLLLEGAMSVTNVAHRRVSLAMPSAHFARDKVDGYVRELAACAAAIGQDLAACQ